MLAVLPGFLCGLEPDIVVMSRPFAVGNRALVIKVGLPGVAVGAGKPDGIVPVTMLMPPAGVVPVAICLDGWRNGGVPGNADGVLPTRRTRRTDWLVAIEAGAVHVQSTCTLSM